MVAYRFCDTTQTPAYSPPNRPPCRLPHGLDFSLEKDLRSI